MLQIETKNLPCEQRLHLHPEFLANEQAYLRMREDLLCIYPGQWVAVCGDKVIASGRKLLEVINRASAINSHAFVAMVGMEDQVVFRARRAVFPYDQAYLPFPLPRVFATFWNHAQTHSQVFGDVIPDTGADISLLPDSDCQAIELYNSPCLTGLVGGVTESARPG